MLPTEFPDDFHIGKALEAEAGELTLRGLKPKSRLRFDGTT
jgi:hypothetical protein